jgi:hypothetical protein
MRKGRKLVDSVLVTHRKIALGADWPEVVQVGRAAFTFRLSMANMKTKWRHDVFTPRHEALVFKEPVTTPQDPYLLSERTRDFYFHIRVC